MLEFMSCARPVILGVKGHAQELLERSQGGVCIEPGNAQALFDAVLRLRAQPELCEAFGRNGREFIVQNLSRRRTAEDYLNILQKLLPMQNAAGRAAAA
jgi:glycosyltransferase involved in cell wall biosynthesis